VAAEPVTLSGYRRPDGRVGIRNHVAILPVDDLSNAVCENVAKVVPGTLALPHHYGRLQDGDDLELTFRTLIGNGANPNVAAVVVVCIEPSWAQRVAEGIARSGKPVEAYSIERSGDLKTLAAAARTAQQMLQDATELRREPVERRELLTSIKCGESDTTTGLASCPTVSQVVDRHVQAGGTVIFGETSELTGGEHLVAARCRANDLSIDPKVHTGFACKRTAAYEQAYVTRLDWEGARNHLARAVIPVTERVHQPMAMETRYGLLAGQRALGGTIAKGVAFYGPFGWAVARRFEVVEGHIGLSTL